MTSARAKLISPAAAPGDVDAEFERLRAIAVARDQSVELIIRGLHLQTRAILAALATLETKCEHK